MAEDDDLTIARPSPFPPPAEAKRQRSEMALSPATLRLAYQLERSTALSMILENLTKMMPGLVDEATTGSIMAEQVQFLENPGGRPEVIGTFTVSLSLRDRNRNRVDGRPYDG